MDRSANSTRADSSRLRPDDGRRVLAVHILHLSWEYPPLVYGGLGRHVHALAEAQAAQGHEVTVLTQAVAGGEPDQIVNGVRVVRVPHDPPAVPFTQEYLLTWVLGLETAMIRRGLELMADLDPDVVHGHDWIVAHAACDLSAAARARRAHPVALVVTIHATEAGRHQGWLPGDLSRAIHSVEWWLTHQADRVIACSEHMRWEIRRLFEIADEDISVVPNGVDMRSWSTSRREVERARDRHAPRSPLLVYVGRLEWEKGVHTLIEAMPRLRRRLPGVRLVIAGRGSAADTLRQQAIDKRVSSAIEFSGWLPERELHALMAAADAMVIPSIYEPFGMVALEATALGAPVVVARSGGLSEFVREGETGYTFTPGDARDLARAITQAVQESASSAAMVRTAQARLRESYLWERIARLTVDVYERSLASAREHQRPTRSAWPPPAPAEGNLLIDPA